MTKEVAKNKKEGHSEDQEGTLLHLFHSGREYFNLLLELIENARESIRILVYIYQDDKTGRNVTDALLRARKRGVEVMLLIDAWGSVELPRRYRKEFEDAGVQFRKFSPHFAHSSFYLGRLMHIKLVVVDGEEAVIGGINISDDYNDTEDSPAWLDYAVQISDPSMAHSLDNYCMDLFRKNINAKTLERYELKAKNYEVQIHDWFHRASDISNSYNKLIEESRKEVVIMTSYFLPGYPIISRLARAARRGVDIHLVISAHSDIPFMKAGIQYFYPWMQRNNIHIYEWKSTVLHAKLMLVDGEVCTIGSYNLNSLSRFHSLEMNLLVREATFVRKLDDELKNIMSDSKRTIKVERYESNWFRHKFHWLVYRIMRWMLKVLFSITKAERRMNKTIE